MGDPSPPLTNYVSVAIRRTLNKPRTRVHFWSRNSLKGSNAYITRKALVSHYEFIHTPPGGRGLVRRILRQPSQQTNLSTLMLRRLATHSKSTISGQAVTTKSPPICYPRSHRYFAPQSHDHRLLQGMNGCSTLGPGLDPFSTGEVGSTRRGH